MTPGQDAYYDHRIEDMDSPQYGNLGVASMPLILPNVRKLLIPDAGYTLFEGDLAGADAQVVAWEAEDEDLKTAFRSGVDVHAKNAEDMWGAEFIHLAGHARDKKRQDTKRAVHATNYGGAARTLATTLGWTTHQAESFQRRWFSIHPGIKTNFQGKVQQSISRNRTVTNPYKFRRVFFERADACYTEALAWIPQSTVALTTYLGAFQLEVRYPKVQILLQVHDSLVFQFPSGEIPPAEEISTTLQVKTPYEDPLYIPWGLSSSTKSWGDCEKVVL